MASPVTPGAAAGGSCIRGMHGQWAGRGEMGARWCIQERVGRRAVGTVSKPGHGPEASQPLGEGVSVGARLQ